jgi:hypothetical protein
MIEFIGRYNSSHITIVDWTLSTSDRTIPPTELSVIVGFSLYGLGSDHAENNPLPSNGCPLLLRIRCHGMCLPSRCLTVDLCVKIYTARQDKKHRNTWES